MDLVNNMKPQNNSNEFSSITKLNGRVQNKRQAIKASLFYTHVINTKSIGNWVLFALSIFFSIILIISAWVVKGIYANDPWMHKNIPYIAKCFQISWIALMTFWVTVIALKHTIMYFAQTKDNGSELLIVSKPVTRKILYWSRVLYFFIYIVIYSMIIMLLTIIFCAVMGFNNFPISSTKFILLSPIVYIFFGMIVMSFTAFFCIISSTKTVNTIVSLSMISSILLFGITPIIGGIVVSENYRTNIGEKQYEAISDLKIDYMEYSKAMEELKAAIDTKILNDVKNHFRDESIVFKYSINSWGWEKEQKEYKLDDISGFGFQKLNTDGDYYERKDGLLIDYINFGVNNNNNNNNNKDGLRLSKDYNFISKDYGSTINWEVGKNDIYKISNYATQLMYNYYNNWITGNANKVIKVAIGAPSYSTIIKIGNYAAKQYSYSNLNKYAPLAFMDYLNFFYMPTDLFGYGDVSMISDSGYGNDSITCGFGWSNRFMPELKEESISNRDKNKIIQYRLINNKLPSQSPSWGVALFWIAISVSSLLSSYFLFRKKDFR